MDFGLKSVLASLPPFRSQTQDDLDGSMMAANQGVSMMHDLYTMHVCMMHVLYNKYHISVRYNIHPSNLIPPTHVFNGEFLFLGFLVWALISTGDIKNRRTCQSLKKL